VCSAAYSVTHAAWLAIPAADNKDVLHGASFDSGLRSGGKRAELLSSQPPEARWSEVSLRAERLQKDSMRPACLLHLCKLLRTAPDAPARRTIEIPIDLHTVL
jgi:hypothetical protein